MLHKVVLLSLYQNQPTQSTLENFWMILSSGAHQHVSSIDFIATLKTLLISILISTLISTFIKQCRIKKTVFVLRESGKHGKKELWFALASTDSVPGATTLLMSIYFDEANKDQKSILRPFLSSNKSSLKSRYIHFYIPILFLPVVHFSLCCHMQIHRTYQQTQLCKVQLPPIFQQTFILFLFQVQRVNLLLEPTLTLQLKKICTSR